MRFICHLSNPLQQCCPGEEPLPHKNSIGWIYSVQKDLGFKKQTVTTTEPSEVDPKQESEFKDFVNNLVREKDIPLHAWAWDLAAVFQQLCS